MAEGERSRKAGISLKAFRTGFPASYRTCRAVFFAILGVNIIIPLLNSYFPDQFWIVTGDGAAVEVAKLMVISSRELVAWMIRKGCAYRIDVVFTQVFYSNIVSFLAIIAVTVVNMYKYILFSAEFKNNAIEV